MIDDTRTNRRLGNYELHVSEDAQIVIKLAAIDVPGGHITIDPIVLSRADSLRVAVAVAEKRAAEAPPKEPSQS